MIIGKSLEIPNPILFKNGESLKLCTVGQLNEVYRISEDVIENLSDSSFYELSNGYEDDINKVFDLILEETFLSLYGGDNGEPNIRTGNELEYFKALSSTLEESMRLHNLAYFIISVLPDFIMNWHHVEWANLTQQQRFSCFIAARDHGKSYFFSHALPLWNMYKYAGRRIVNGGMRDDLEFKQTYLVSFEMGLTELLLDIVKSTIEVNDILKEKLLPVDALGKIKMDFGNKRSFKAKNGAEMRLKSMGSAFRGIHCGQIILDDPMKDNVIYSEVQRKKTIEYFHSVLMNAIIPTGSVTVVGTPFHQSDLYGDLKARRGKGGFRVYEYPSIFPDGRILWADRYDYTALKEKREAQGSIIFSRELLCRPVSSASSIFPDYMTKLSKIKGGKYTIVSNIDDHQTSFKKVVTGVDFAYSSNVGADYSVFTTWGLTYDGEMILIHMWRGKGKSYKQQIDILKAIDRKFRPDIMVCEANNFQRIFVDMLEDHGLKNIVPHVTTAGAKHSLESGLPSLSILFENGKIILPYGDEMSRGVTDFILDEFNSMAYTDRGTLESVGQHDDTVMSTFMAKRGFCFNGSDFTATFL